MKIVYNSKGYGLQLTADEMQMVATDLGVTVREPNKGSNDTWFREIDWQQFRGDEYLVSLVEQGKLSNKDLRIVELPIDDDWYIHTDHHSYEDVLYADTRYVSAITGE
jgi:hypothetical protein